MTGALLKYLRGLFVCFIVLGALIPVAASAENIAPLTQTVTGPHLDFVIGPELVGWGFTVWNYGTSPADLIRWSIKIEGVNGTRVLGSHRSGVIPYLRSIHTLYMLPMTIPKTKIIIPYGHGEVTITVTISSRNANYSITHTSHWMLNGFKITALHPFP